jgi:hypothetical protein
MPVKPISSQEGMRNPGDKMQFSKKKIGFMSPDFCKSSKYDPENFSTHGWTGQMSAGQPCSWALNKSRMILGKGISSNTVSHKAVTYSGVFCHCVF